MDIIEKQLQYLNETMKETAAEANSFLLKYHFGGLVAVLALLNIDLVLLDSASLNGKLDYALLAIAIILVLVLSYKYFGFVLNHYSRFAKSHRKLKYKYELTLHLALCKGDSKDYQYYMEQSVSGLPDSRDDEIKAPKDKQYKFSYMAKYLLNHHRLKYNELEEKDDTYLLMAMSILGLTLAIRGIFLVIGDG